MKFQEDRRSTGNAAMPWKAVWVDGSASLSKDIEWLLQHSHCRERAWGHNYAFEEMVDSARLAVFEDEVAAFQASGEFDPALHDGHVLLQGHGSYHQRWVKTAGDPHTFGASNAKAAFGPFQETNWLVRLESLEHPLSRWRRDFADLQDAFGTDGRRTPEQAGALHDFLEQWNRNAPGTPRCATFADELRDDLLAPNWANRLRTRLGLAHHNPPRGKTIKVALMVYRASEVRRIAAGRPGIDHLFTRPTVLDQEPNAYFFPAPPEVNGGRCVSLAAQRPGARLICELLHPKIDYRAEHIFRLGEISTPTPADLLRLLRNSHLDCLREASGRGDFGKLITDCVDV